ncbi:UNVERIFIED_CONTAM: hypothetical protein FKN15_034991 [Acipenser sinensis]
MEYINAKFVSQKISKTRWRPISSTSLQQPEVFATGSWDNEDNKVSIWSVAEQGMQDDYEGDPQLLCEYKHDGDVMDLQFLDQERIVTASSTGSVTIFRHYQNSQTLSVNQRWERAHYHSCDNAPCTGVVCNSPEIVTVGEDGRINLLRVDHKGIVRTIASQLVYLRLPRYLTPDTMKSVFMEYINAKFVSQKISKTRWRPISSTSLQQPEVFATGSWDNEDNKVSIWSVAEQGMQDDYEGDPQLLCEYKHDGDVMDLQFLDQERIVTASSTGSVTIFRHYQNSQTLSVNQRWERAHYHSCDNAPCTGVVCNSPEIVTVGEDGRINLLRVDHKGIVRTIGTANRF